jgi:hypothetical protein
VFERSTPSPGRATRQVFGCWAWPAPRPPSARAFRSAWPLLGLLLAGCAQRQYFSPTEHLIEETQHDNDVAQYELADAQGRFGDARVWSEGAYRDSGLTVLNVSLAVRNTGSSPITVSARDLALDAVRMESGELPVRRPQESGTLQVAPQAQLEVVTHFLLPRDVDPKALRAFTFVWSVRAGQREYAQRTPFTQELPYTSVQQGASGVPPFVPSGI